MSPVKIEPVKSFEATHLGFLNPGGLHRIVRLLMKRYKWIISSIFVCLAFAITITLMMKPSYEATAMVELNKSSDTMDLGLPDELSQGLTGGIDTLQTDLQTEIAILKGDSLALAVIQRLNLVSQPEFANRKGAGNSGSDSSLSLDRDSQERSRLLAIFHKHLSVESVHGTRLIQVTYESHNRDEAANIANALIDAYRSQYLQSHYDATIETSNWLTKQLSDLKANVEASEQRLTDFEKQTGIFSFGNMMPSDSGNGGIDGGGGIHSPVIEKLDQLNTELTDAEANRIQKEAIYRIIQTGNTDAIIGLASNAMASGPNGAQSSVLTEGGGLTNLEYLRRQRNLLEVSLADAATKFGDNNPHLIDLKTQLQALDNEVKQEQAEIGKRAEADFQLAQQAEDRIRQEFEKQQHEANDLNEKAVQAAVLSQEAFSRKKLYDDLYTKLQEANVSSGIQATNISVVDPARPQFFPIRPKPISNTAVGLMLGVFLGFGLAYLADAFDRRIASPLEIEEIVGLPVIAMIPEFIASSRREELQSSHSDHQHGNALADQDALLTPAWILEHPRSPASEAYRSLRTSIMLSRPGRQPQVILVTSCTPGEGKTTLSQNLGVAFAQHGKKVMIIEADMRRPHLIHTKELKTPHVGLSTVLAGRSTLSESILREVLVPALDVLPAGPPPPMPSEMLGSAAFDDLLQDLRSQYEVVVIDSPPALLVTDPVSMSAKSDAVLWVCRDGIVTKPGLLRASHLIERNRIPVIGFIFNCMAKGGGYSYGYGYGYGYESYHAYYEEDNSNES